MEIKLNKYSLNSLKAYQNQKNELEERLKEIKSVMTCICGAIAEENGFDPTKEKMSYDLTKEVLTIEEKPIIEETK